MDHYTTIKEIMTTDLTTVEPNTPLAKFKNIFKRRGIHHLPVEDKELGLVGIISTEDVYKAERFYTANDSICAEHIMTPNVTTIYQRLGLLEAAKIFVENRFRALPVVNYNGDFVGLVTHYDLIKEMMKALELDIEMEGLEDLV